jgi:hypothetical protein
MSKPSFNVNQNTQIHKDLQRVRGDVTKLRNEKTLQAEKDTSDVLLAGQEDRKKAIKEIEKIETAAQKEAKVAEDKVLDHLDSKKRFYQSYKEEIARTLADVLGKLDWIRGWTADVVVTDGNGITIKGHHFQSKDGVLLIVYKPDGAVLHQGMLITQEPSLDYAKVYDLAMKTENEMDSARGLLLTHNGDTSAIMGSDGKPVTNKKRQPTP